MLAPEWAHPRVFADFACALACASYEAWPVPEPNLGPFYPDEIAEVVHWAISYGRVVYRPEFAAPDPSRELDLVVVARMWDGRAVALVARTGTQGWAGGCEAVGTVCRSAEDAVMVGLDERAQQALGFAGWYL